MTSFNSFFHYPNTLRQCFKTMTTKISLYFKHIRFVRHRENCDWITKTNQLMPHTKAIAVYSKTYQVHCMGTILSISVLNLVVFIDTTWLQMINVGLICFLTNRTSHTMLRNIHQYLPHLRNRSRRGYSYQTVRRGAHISLRTGTTQS
jgi:hypothetical protein